MDDAELPEDLLVEVLLGRIVLLLEEQVALDQDTSRLEAEVAKVFDQLERLAETLDRLIDLSAPEMDVGAVGEGQGEPLGSGQPDGAVDLLGLAQESKSATPAATPPLQQSPQPQSQASSSALEAFATLIAFVDADYSDHPAELTRVLAPVLADEADLCLGSRVLGGASMQALLPQAWFGNRLACFLMRALFGARYTDLGPMRALSIPALERMGMRDRDFGWTVEMQLKASSLSLRTLEVPVSYRPRVGASKITGTLLGTLRAGWKILGWIAAWRLRLWLRPLRSSEQAD